MDVILIEDVAHVGVTGDMVKVAPGYGRNFLLPKKLAVLASKKNVRELEHQKRLANFRKAKAMAHAQSVAKQLASITLTFAKRVGEQDKLFGSVTSHDVAEALVAKGVEIDRRKVVLHDPIKTIGEHTVQIRLDGGIHADVKVSVVAE